MNKVVLLCRPGFEKSAPQKLPIKPASGEIFGFARVKRMRVMSFMNVINLMMAIS